MKSMKKSLWWVLCLTMLTVLMVSSVNQALSAESGGNVSKDIFIYALILALFIAIPTIFDVIMSYHSRNKNWQLLIEKASQDNLTKEELEALITATSGSPPGISGMSRSLMAYAVIIILGIVLFHLMVYCSNSENDKITTIISNILSMLGATLASITGFYFGGRSAEERGKAEEAQRQQQGQPPVPPIPPPVPPVAPPEGAPTPETVKEP